MNLADKLKAEAEIYDEMEANHEYGYYNRKALPEILAYNKQYRKDNPDDKVGYNSNIIKYIANIENIAEDWDILHTQVYLSQTDLRKEKENEYKEKMLADGYIELNEQVVKDAFANNRKLLVNATTSYDWLTQKIEEVYKPFVKDNECFLMKPKAKTRGIYLSRFENAFCKLV